MSEIADRYRKVADEFTRRVEAVPANAWERPAPCEGWVARDVVGHLVDWLSGYFFGTWSSDVPGRPSVADDPVAAWRWLDDGIRSALDDPAISTVSHDGPMGSMTFEASIDMICTPDVLIHTWDLARATGLDESLDPAEVRRFLDGVAGHEEAMQQSGHYGPPVDAPAGADDQTRLLAVLGRSV